MFSVASGLHGMGKWAWHSEDDSRYRREDRVPVAGEMARVLGQEDHSTCELQRC